MSGVFSGDIRNAIDPSSPCPTSSSLSGQAAAVLPAPRRQPESSHGAERDASHPVLTPDNVAHAPQLGGSLLEASAGVSLSPVRHALDDDYDFKEAA
jgi:hypothetical protein